ncbi:uncharacterized protein LOC126719898 [Quercus robur]|uniref:uncharacterized protein LOC126719898 n=1 Tax=Quercus robur TaxID=38942 RepID=UPI002163A6F5|nr:uncharacterized protein LOC126719898 [Quercus robur]
MYPNLFNGLGLKDKDLSKYDTPQVGFDGKVVIPQGQISLPVNMKGKEVVVAFIVVASFSPYTVILGRLWIHAMGAILSTLHVKVKFRTKQGIAVGVNMKGEDRVEMLLFLINNVDVFACSPYEVPRVDPEFIVHKLNVDPSFPPKKQKPRRSAKEHVEVVKFEVKRLKDTGVIREIFFLEWLANTVVVKKKNGK